MKGVGLFITILFATLLLVSSVSAACDDKTTRSTCMADSSCSWYAQIDVCNEKANLVPCTDTDGGKNYFTTGRISGSTGEIYQPQINLTDYCFQNTNQLKEHFCVDTYYADFETITCVNGCAEGACIANSDPPVDPPAASCEEINSESTCKANSACAWYSQNSDCYSKSSLVVCSDSDNGKNIYVQGRTKGITGISIQDYCKTNDTTLREHFCVDTYFIGLETINCPNGCESGACLGTPPIDNNPDDLGNLSLSDFNNDGELNIKDIVLMVKGLRSQAKLYDLDKDDFVSVKDLILFVKHMQQDRKRKRGQSFCGDGMITYPEECDGHELGGATCETFGLDFGEVTCNTNCKLDMSNCVTDVNKCPTVACTQTPSCTYMDSSALDANGCPVYPCGIEVCEDSEFLDCGSGQDCNCDFIVGTIPACMSGICTCISEEPECSTNYECAAQIACPQVIGGDTPQCFMGNCICGPGGTDYPPIGTSCTAQLTQSSCESTGCTWDEINGFGMCTKKDDSYCRDSDYGSHFEKGRNTVKVFGYAAEEDDFCDSSTVMFEYYCDDMMPLTKRVNCEFGCYNGACRTEPTFEPNCPLPSCAWPANYEQCTRLDSGNEVNADGCPLYPCGNWDCDPLTDQEPPTYTPTCYDGDSGRNYEVKSRTNGILSSGNNYNQYDECRDSERVLERYCDGNSPVAVTHTCTYGCSDGVCLSSPPQDPPQDPPTDQACYNDDDCPEDVYDSWGGGYGFECIQGECIEVIWEPPPQNPPTSDPEPYCGDGNVDFGEACDGDNFNGKTCQDYDFDSGNLVCTGNCLLSSINCIRDPVSDPEPTDPYCGDGTVDADEECDGFVRCSDLGLGKGFATCTNCKIVDTSNCLGTPVPIEDPNCGNGKLDPEEDCDGEYMGDLISCQDKGFDTGTVTCNNCMWDYSRCSNPEPIAKCGNNVIDAGEACDGNKFPQSNSCTNYNFKEGYVTCTSSCTINKQYCSTCGNNKKENGEVCDGTAFGGKTCMSYGWSGGELSCRYCEQIIQTGCTSNSKYPTIA